MSRSEKVMKTFLEEEGYTVDKLSPKKEGIGIPDFLVKNENEEFYVEVKRKSGPSWEDKRILMKQVMKWLELLRDGNRVMVGYARDWKSKLLLVEIDKWLQPKNKIRGKVSKENIPKSKMIDCPFCEGSFEDTYRAFKHVEDKHG